jgi:hypothetical protein
MRPDWSDSGGNSYDGQAGANVSNDGGGGDDNEEDGDNEDWALWDKVTTISVRYHFVPYLVVNHFETWTDACNSTRIFLAFLVQLYSKK